MLIGGQTRDGPIAGAARANIAPQAPFFQVGLVGATVPALKIDGEIGQQLGYLNANTIGIVNFVILLVIGWAFAHKEQVRAMRERAHRPAAAAAPLARGEVALARCRLAAADRQARRCQAVMPPSTFTTSVQPLRSRNPVAAADRVPPAHITSSGRSFGSSAWRSANDDIGNQARALDPDVAEFVELADVDEERLRRVGAVQSVGGLGRVDGRDSAGGLAHRVILLSRGGSIEASGSAARRASRSSIGRQQIGQVEAAGHPGRFARPRQALRAPSRFLAMPRGLPRTPWTNAAASLIRPW